MKSAIRWLGLFLLIGPAAGWSQQDPETPQRDPETPAATVVGGLIDFLPPGARSLGFGGAFIGLADDATAAESNPAGLTVLTRPEVSIHVRNSSFFVPFQSLTVSDLRDGLGDDRLTDGNQLASIANDVLGTQRVPPNSEAGQVLDQSVTSASFVSVVVPLGKLSLSAYYQETANNEASTDSFFLWDPFFIDFFHVDEAASAKLRQTGFAAGYKLTDRVSIGGSIRRAELEFFSSSTLRSDLFLDVELALADQIAEQFPPGQQQAVFDQLVAEFLAGVLLEGSFFTEFFEVEDRRQGTATDLTYNLGILVQAHENVKVGAVYKRTGTFDLPRTSTSVSCFADSPSDPVSGTPGQCSEVSDVLFFEEVDLETTQPPALELPSFFGAGVAAQLMDQSLTLALDINRIGFGSLNVGDEGALNTLFEPIRDATIFRVGAEKVFVLPYEFLNVISFRGGFFNDPDHDGFRNIDSSETHITFGLGAVFNNRFQIDFGSEFSESVDNLLVSAIIRF